MNEAKRVKITAAIFVAVIFILLISVSLKAWP